MNSMERVVLTLNHKEADRVPAYPIIAGAARRLVNASYEDWSKDADICAESMILAQKEFDLECIVILIDLSVECTAWGGGTDLPGERGGTPQLQKPGDQGFRGL